MPVNVAITSRRAQELWCQLVLGAVVIDAAARSNNMYSCAAAQLQCDSQLTVQLNLNTVWVPSWRSCAIDLRHRRRAYALTFIRLLNSLPRFHYKNACTHNPRSPDPPPLAVAMSAGTAK